ncbi:MAG: TraR/DksA family transcriptional regulator [Spirochaetes bacterium]|nr:TraR/DksA family transcriptional regulator [Spirochaetota bacterium]
MTEEQRGELEELIRSKIEDIAASMPYLQEETKAIAPSVSLGRLTRMEALNDKGVNEHVLEQNRRQLQRLANALKRVDTNEYGHCVRCGGEIPIERLRVVPEAVVCVPCAENKRE